jgi:hypothetical protein
MIVEFDTFVHLIELVHSTFTNRLEIWGIQPQTSNTYTPQQNGVSKRVNGTVMDTIRAFFHDGSDRDW